MGGRREPPTTRRKETCTQFEQLNGIAQAPGSSDSWWPCCWLTSWGWSRCWWSNRAQARPAGRPSQRRSAALSVATLDRHGTTAHVTTELNPSKAPPRCPPRTPRGRRPNRGGAETGRKRAVSHRGGGRLGGPLTPHQPTGFRCERNVSISCWSRRTLGSSEG